MHGLNEDTTAMTAWTRSCCSQGNTSCRLKVLKPEEKKNRDIRQKYLKYLLCVLV